MWGTLFWTLVDPWPARMIWFNRRHAPMCRPLEEKIIIIIVIIARRFARAVAAPSVAPMPAEMSARAWLPLLLAFLWLVYR